MRPGRPAAVEIWARAQARFRANVLLPPPPLPEAMAPEWRMPLGAPGWTPGPPPAPAAAGAFTGETATSMTVSFTPGVARRHLSTSFFKCRAILEIGRASCRERV